MRRWWRPAAATSTARRPSAWPRTSARSGGSRSAGRSAPTAGIAGQAAWPRRTATSSPSVAAPSDLAPAHQRRLTDVAERHDQAERAQRRRPGRSCPGRGAASRSARAPRRRTGPRCSPGSARRRRRAGPTAMGRSSPAPPLRTPEGARLTVSRRSGHGSPLERMAARTRSRDSRTAASGSPTMVNPGRPLETWTSTETARAVAPVRVADAMTACCTTVNGRIDRIPMPDVFQARELEVGGAPCGHTWSTIRVASL